MFWPVLCDRVGLEVVFVLLAAQDTEEDRKHCPVLISDWQLYLTTVFNGVTAPMPIFLIVITE